MTLRNTSRLLQEYTIRRLLGAGAFGTVVECSNNLDKQKYAIKVTPATKDDDALREVENLVRVPGHKNLVQYFTCWKDSLSQTALVSIQQTLGLTTKAGHQLILPARQQNLDVICIQMELCGEDLRSHINRSRNVNQQKAIGIFIQLVRGVEHLHKHGIIHRDLKPENIFTSGGNNENVKIGDLGIATFHSASQSLTHTKATGTRLYFAPEQEGHRYGKSIDIYALGIIFLEILNPIVQPSFNQGSYQLLIEMVTDLKFKQVIPLPVQSKWPVASKIILQMTSVNSEDRPRCVEILAAFLTNANGNNNAPSLLDKKTPQLSPIGNQQTKHFGVSCDGCGMQDISGARYKCTVCDDYDLCEKCETRTGIHPEEHALLKIRTSSSSPPQSATDKLQDILQDLTIQKRQQIDSTKLLNPVPNQFPFRYDPLYNGNNCRKCQKPGKFIQVDNRNWHFQCFVCAACGNKIKDRYYTEKDNYLCTDDYRKYIAPRCQSCSKPCFDEYAIINNLPFHHECFICFHCGVELDTCCEKNGKFYCVKHYEKLFAPRCHSCNKPCTSTFITVENLAFHVGCFKCCRCRVKLDDEYFEENGKYYCLLCLL